MRIKKIIELINNDISNEEIKKIIYYNFQHVRLSSEDINKHRRKIDKSINYINRIKIIIKKLNIPITILDIKEYLSLDFGIAISSNEVSKIIWANWSIIQNEIHYDSKEKTFSIKQGHIAPIFDSENKDENHFSKTTNNQFIKKENLLDASISEEVSNINDVVIREINDFKKSYYVSNGILEKPINNLIIEKLLNSHLSKFIINKPISIEEKNSFILKVCISNTLFLNELKLILECFNEKKTKLFQGEIINFLKITRKTELKIIVDLNKLLSNDLNTFINKESIYFNIIDSIKFVQFIKDVTKEITFYNLYVESITVKNSISGVDIEEEKKDISQNNESIITEKNSDNSESLTNINDSINEKTEEKNEDTEIIFESKFSENDKNYINTNEIIRISKDLEKNIKELNGVLNISNSHAIDYPLKKTIETLIINDITYHIIFKNHPTLPLFFYEFNSSNGNKQIIINKGNTIFDEKNVEFIILFATTLFHTKNSMTSKEAEIFINRFQQNINLIK